MYFGGGYAERFYCILRDRWKLWKTVSVLSCAWESPKQIDMKKIKYFYTFTLHWKHGCLLRKDKVTSDIADMLIILKVFSNVYFILVTLKALNLRYCLCIIACHPDSTEIKCTIYAYKNTFVTFCLKQILHVIFYHTKKLLKFCPTLIQLNGRCLMRFYNCPSSERRSRHN